jgi:GntR family transcriptional regulator, transcriptional repressor for pyruvate dehydrogenase complex
MKASLSQRQKEQIESVARRNPSRGGKKILLSAHTADLLEAEIAGGQFHGHDKLPSQEELCTRFSVSSSVVREAIHLLKARNIVYTVNGVGSFIAERSVDPLKHLLLHYVSGAQEAHDYSELMELRLAIETTCAEKIAEHNSPEALKNLHRCLRIMETSFDHLQDFSDADLAFHSAIVDSSGNSLIKAIHSSLRPTIRRFMDLTCTNRLDVERNCKEHGRIYAAISSGNVEEASQSVRDHILFARRNYGLLASPPGNAVALAGYRVPNRKTSSGKSRR